MLSTISCTLSDTRIESLFAPEQGPAVVLLHGNSACKEVFASQLEALRHTGFTVVAPDFPGHGASADAADPHVLYSFAGLAALTFDLMDRLRVVAAHVVGWSLGGHVGLEMLGRAPARILSLTLIGAPPVAPSLESLAAAFLANPAAALAAKPTWTEDETQQFACAALGGDVPPTMLAAFRRADGRARAMIISSALAGAALDEIAVIHTAGVPIAVIHGANDRLTNLQYTQSLPWRGIWGGSPFVVDGAGHAPHWERPHNFDDILLRFLALTGAGSNS
jgi:pimeloyl-ACP methyl ester carboxylesterase